MRERPVKGDMIIGGDRPVERGPFVRRDMIQKGMFLIGGVPMVKSTSVRYGDAPGLDAIRRRMDALETKVKQAAEAIRRERS